MVLEQTWCGVLFKHIWGTELEKWSNFIAIIFFLKERKKNISESLLYILNCAGNWPLMYFYCCIFRSTKTLVSFLKPLKEVLTTLTQQPTFKQKNLIFKLKKVQLLCPTPVWSTTRWLPSEETKGSKTHTPPRFDASKASHVSVTLQLPNVTITWTVNAYAWSPKTVSEFFLTVPTTFFCLFPGATCWQPQSADLLRVFHSGGTLAFHGKVASLENGALWIKTLQYDAYILEDFTGAQFSLSLHHRPPQTYFHILCVEE